MTWPVSLQIDAVDNGARTARALTAYRQFETPCFMPVGTRGTVRAVSMQDLEDIGFQVMLANAYHLALRPGAEVIAAMGGIHSFSGWSGAVLTDSGGYQTRSLAPVVDDNGVNFRSVYDGSMIRLTPESAVAIQELIGADIQMVLDQCPSLPAPIEVVKEAMLRTVEWARRAKKAHKREDQALFGIIQGGIDLPMRLESVQRTVECDFSGYAIGGLSVGEAHSEMLEVLEATVSMLPEGRPRYLMGVGDPVSLLEAISFGVDMFDCVFPTRLGRHGTVLSETGRYQLRRKENALEQGPLDPSCHCSTCMRWSRGYLRHLLMVKEPTAWRLISIHNLTWTNRLIIRAREAIRQGELSTLIKEVKEVWEMRDNGEGNPRNS
ncbi:MAG: tRNA guanosine(34) transglycosylase Tgt [Actinobacteria bacterium]|nr:tRNA guanosine(34) transglycosylase Tgt [Actinomycetota bacterium]